MLIAIDRIYVGDRLRSVTDEQVAAIAESIREVGLLSPIAVYPRQIMHANIAKGGFGLVSGLHRLEACKSLGLSEIEANVVELDDLDRQIAECDENLCGTKLSSAERATFVRRRKEAYEAKHPETRNGATGNGRNQLRQIGEATSRFTEDTAAKTGNSERAIQRDARRGEKISEDVLADIAGTDLDKGIVLDELAATPREQQAAKVVQLRQEIADHKLMDSAAGDVVVARGLEDAAQRIMDYLPEREIPALLGDLDSAKLHKLANKIRNIWKTGARIGSDTPVFDRTAAGRA